MSGGDRLASLCGLGHGVLDDAYEGLLDRLAVPRVAHQQRYVVVEVEGANGELGFYVVSDGSDRPYRVRCRPPCLPPLAALHRMIVGEMVADLIPTFGSVNMIGGELDR